MRRQLEQSEIIWKGILQVAENRSKFFGKHGERFDRRLYAEVDSLIRLSLKFREMRLVRSDPETFRNLLAIQKRLLRVGQDEYLHFP